MKRGQPAVVDLIQGDGSEPGDLPARVVDAETLSTTLRHVARQACRLALTVLGEELPLDTLTVFARDDAERNTVEWLIRRAGEVSDLSHDGTLYVETDIDIIGHRIRYLGVRRPDASRPERGYGDYPVDGLSEMRSRLAHNPHVTAIVSGNSIELLELRHPDFDVRGYVVEA